MRGFTYRLGFGYRMLMQRRFLMANELLWTRSANALEITYDGGKALEFPIGTDSGESPTGQFVDLPYGVRQDLLLTIEAAANLSKRFATGKSLSKWGAAWEKAHAD